MANFTSVLSIVLGKSMVMLMLCRGVRIPGEANAKICHLLNAGYVERKGEEEENE